MEEIVKKLLEKHKSDKDLTSEKDYIKPGWDWSEANLSSWNLSGLSFSYKWTGGSNFDSCDFSNANLKNTSFKFTSFKHTNFTGANLENSNLEFATLEEARLVSANLKSANLESTNMISADLRRADISEAKFNYYTDLKNVNFYQCKLNNSGLKYAGKYIDKIVLQEKSKDYIWAKDVYLSLKNYFKNEGMYDLSGEYYYREKLMETKCNWVEKKYLKWVSNMFFKLFTGYGERPSNILIWWINIIFGYAFIYYYFSGIYNGIACKITSYNPNFLEALYFSIVTFTTLGFGDLAPKPGLFQLIASSEALFGAIFMAMFIFVFARKMIR